MGKAGGYQEVVLAAAAGDRNAFSELMIDFRSMALTVAVQRLSDRRIAEDAVQEAFLKAFLKLSSLRDASSFPSWFRRILRSCCNRLEERQRLLPLESEEALPFLVDPTPGPYELMVRYQSRAMVAKTLEALDGVAREACVQRYILGLPYKKIAASLRVPEGTIKRRLHDVRDRVIREFEAVDRPGIHVGYLPVSDHLLGMVSHRLNPDRLNIHMKRFLSWASLVAAMENGLLDAAFVMAPLALALRNRGLRIVYVLDAHHEGSAISVRNDVHSKRLSAWNRVGMPHAISTHSMLLADILGMGSGPNLSAITPKYSGPSYLLSSLVKRDIDAFFCAEPWATKAVMEGAGRILVRSKDVLPGHICCILVVREDFIEKQGELVRSYLKLLLSTLDYISADYGRSAKIQESYTGVSADIIKHLMIEGEVSFNDVLPDRSRIESVMQMAIRAKILDRPCDLDRFLRTDIL